MTATLARPILVDYEALAVHLRVPVGTLRRWRSEDGWTAYGTDRARRWDLNEATASAQARDRGDEEAEW